MKGRPLYGMSGKRSLLIFFSLIFLFSIPFWALGPIVEQLLPGGLPVDLPISSLMVLAPVSAAVLLVWRKEGPGAAKRLLKGAFDYQRINKWAWYAPILLFWPAAMVLQYGLMTAAGVPLSDPQIPVLIVAGSYVVFFIGALCEEVGWQGYAIGPLQERWNALTASVLLGTVWAAWHIVPLIQMGRSPIQIALQGLGMVATRILIVWLCNNSRGSLFAAILFHAMNNVTTVVLPNYGWPYNAFFALIILVIATATITFLWGPKTLAAFRYARPGTGVQGGAAKLPIPGAGE